VDVAAYKNDLSELSDFLMKLVLMTFSNSPWRLLLKSSCDNMVSF